LELGRYALCGVAAPILFALMVLVEGFVVHGYSQVSQYISDLGAYSLYGSYAFLQNLNFWSFGILVVSFAFGLRRGFPSSRAVPVSLAVFGAMQVAAGFFPDMPFPFPGYVHGFVAVIAFNAIILCQFLVWNRLRHLSSEEEIVWGRYRNYSLASGLLSFILLTVSFVPPETWAGVVITGLKQRAFALIPWSWVEIMALRLFRLSR
jgi:hypothetical membrane protein